MPVIDLLLNLAGLLLWVSWRTFGSDPLDRGSPATLVGTLKRTEPRRMRRWQILGSLVILLVARAWVYCQLGASAEWVPKVDLTVVVLVFRLNAFWVSLLFSLVSFAQYFIVFNFWLLILAILNRGLGDEQPLHKLVRQQLGRLARIPVPLQLMTPLIALLVIWCAAQPLLVQASVVTPLGAWVPLLGQVLLLTVALILTLKYLLPVFLLVHLVLSYVYLGQNPLWDYVATTARRILGPLEGARLRTARLDLGPLVGAVLILLLLDALPRWLMPKLQASSHLWPQ